MSSIHALAAAIAAMAMCEAVIATPAAAAPVSASAAATPREVKVERVRPDHARHPTLRFLAENRDFVRAQLDLLRERPRDVRGAGDEVDPRHLAYRDLLAEIHAARDAVATAEGERRRRELLANVGELQTLEAELDLLERALAAQRARLGVLQAGFAGDPGTALMVVVSGLPEGGAVNEVAIALEGGDAIAVTLTDEHRESLRRGGVIQVFHGRVEPREQVVGVRLAGDRWPVAEAGHVTLDPARDRTTLLRLDLGGAGADQGAGGIRATTWTHDETMPAGGG